MKRTLILILSILVLLLTVAFSLISCDKEEARSIERTEIINGELVVFYNDGTSENLGKIV